LAGFSIGGCGSWAGAEARRKVRRRGTGSSVFMDDGWVEGGE
jgi:hypothetical protein